MAKFHINNSGEAGSCSAQQGKCPFGGEADHYTSADDARAAFEAAQGSSFVRNRVSSQEGYSIKSTWPDSEMRAFSGNFDSAEEAAEAMATMEAAKDGETRVIVRKKATVVSTTFSEEEIVPTPEAKKDFKKINRGKTWQDFTVPEVDESSIIVPPAINDPQGGYMGGRSFRGGKVPDGYQPQKEAAKLIRADILAAKKAGELPQDLDYSVRMNSGSWVTSINIVLGTKDANGKAAPMAGNDAEDPNTIKVRRYLEALGRQYSSDDSNAQVDYFNSHNMARVEYRHEWH